MARKHVYSVLALMALVLVAFGSSKSDSGSPAATTAKSTTKPAKQEAAIAVSASKLVSDYDTNEVAADEKYKGKLLLVSGTVEDIKKDILDNMYITLDAGHVIRSVQCTFGDEHKSKLAKLSKGTAVKVRGTCKGLMMTVGLDDCELVE